MRRRQIERIDDTDRSREENVIELSHIATESHNRISKEDLRTKFDVRQFWTFCPSLRPGCKDSMCVTAISRTKCRPFAFAMILSRQQPHGLSRYSSPSTRENLQDGAEKLSPTRRLSFSQYAIGDSAGKS